MAELNIEALKRLNDSQTREKQWGTAIIGQASRANTASSYAAYLSGLLPAIIAALEDRERLQLTIDRLTSGEAVHEMANALALAEQDRERLRQNDKAMREAGIEQLSALAKLAFERDQLLVDRERLQKRYDEQTADCSQVSQRYEELLDQIEKYNYLEGIDAALEDRERLRAAIEHWVQEHPYDCCSGLRAALEGRDD